MGILFWTSSVPPATSTSNPPLFLTPFGLLPAFPPLLQIPFGLPPCFPPLQRPICRFCKSLLDFLRASRRFNIQSAALSHSFWTSSVPPATSTSNPPLFLTPFGLLPAFPPLQHPIRRFFSLLLDFLRTPRCFNVQSAASANPFWTFSVLPTASTSNPPLFLTPFGLSPAFPPLQHPIRHFHACICRL